MVHNGKRIVLLPDTIPDDLNIKGITVECSNEYRIVIDRAAAPIVQRFVLGHELAHIFLGHFDGLEGMLQDRDKEREANINAWYYYRRFASERD